MGHIKLGFWAIDTASPSCWSLAAAYMRLSTALFIEYQEMKISAGQAVNEVVEAAPATKWKMSVGGCLVQGGMSCCTVVAAKSHLGLGTAKAATKQVDEVGTGHRLHIRHRGAVFRGGYHLGSLCCITVIGLNTRDSVDLLKHGDGPDSNPIALCDLHGRQATAGRFGGHMGLGPGKGRWARTIRPDLQRVGVRMFCHVTLCSTCTEMDPNDFRRRVQPTQFGEAMAGRPAQGEPFPHLATLGEGGGRIATLPAAAMPLPRQRRDALRRRGRKGGQAQYSLA